MTQAERTDPTFGRVTIAIPTRNRAAYLRECVASATTQTYADLEILIGDNASTDETPRVASAFVEADRRVRYIRHPDNLGMVGNWNALLRLASGEFFLLLSDDDLLCADAITRLASACARPGVRMAYGAAYVIDGSARVRDLHARGGPPVERGADFIAAHLAGGRHVNLAATLYRIGRAAEREEYSEDVGAVCDLLHRLTLAATGDVAYVREPVACYREHDGNETLRSGPFVASLLRVVDHPRVRSGTLAAHAAAIHSYVLREIDWLVTRAAVRGRTAAVQEMLAVLDAHGTPTSRLRRRARLLSLGPVRLAAAWRRRWTGSLR